MVPNSHYLLSVKRSWLHNYHIIYTAPERRHHVIEIKEVIGRYKKSTSVDGNGVLRSGSVVFSRLRKEILGLLAYSAKSQTMALRALFATNVLL